MLCQNIRGNQGYLLAATNKREKTQIMLEMFLLPAVCLIALLVALIELLMSSKGKCTHVLQCYIFRECFAFEKNKRYEWMGDKSHVPGHLASDQILVTAHAEGGRNWRTDPNLAYHSWIISLMPIWQNTEVLSSSLCQMCFCMHGYWYIHGGECEETALKLKSVSLCVWSMQMYVCNQFLKIFSSMATCKHEAARMWVVILSKDT